MLIQECFKKLNTNLQQLGTAFQKLTTADGIFLTAVDELIKSFDDLDVEDSDVEDLDVDELDVGELNALIAELT